MIDVERIILSGQFLPGLRMEVLEDLLFASLPIKPGQSQPLSWTQVKAGLDPQRYAVRSVPDLLAKARAWAEYREAERPLAAAIKRLAA